MPQDDPSKTEDPTRRRISKAREQGSVGKSQDFTKAVTLLFATFGAYHLIGHMADQIKRLFVWFFQDGINVEMTTQGVYTLFLMVSTRLAVILLPLLLLLCLVSYITLRLQVGPLWAPKVFDFKWRFLDIAAGLKRLLIDPKVFIRLGKSLLQATIVGIAPYLVLKSEAANILPLFFATPEGIAVYLLKLVYKMFTYALVPMLILGIIDLWWQKFEYNEQLKMSKHEVKDERKQMEGDPLVKQQQRQKMMESMAKRMLEKVPKADVIITNPTHFAVALQYDARVAPAPVVVAKGLDHLAEKIKEIARENNVPIRENKPLARALYKQVEVGDMIPEEMYQAVAAILAQIRKTQRPA